MIQGPLLSLICRIDRLRSAGSSEGQSAPRRCNLLLSHIFVPLTTSAVFLTAATSASNFVSPLWGARQLLEAQYHEPLIIALISSFEIKRFRPPSRTQAKRMARSRLSSAELVRAVAPSGPTLGVFALPDSSRSFKEGILGALEICGTPSSRDLRGLFFGVQAALLGSTGQMLGFPALALSLMFTARRSPVLSSSPKLCLDPLLLRTIALSSSSGFRLYFCNILENNSLPY